MFFHFVAFITSVICVLCTQPTISQAANTTETIIRLQRQYTELIGFSANFEQTLTHKESGTAEKRIGTLLFQKPLQIRWETTKPHQELLVVNSKEIWDFLPDEALVYRYPLSMIQNSRGIIQVITGQATLTQDFDVKSAGKEENFEKFKLYPKEPKPEMVEAMIWVDTTNNLIKRAEITDFYGNKNNVRFISFHPQIKFQTDDFSFIPPKGMDIEDLTQKENQQNRKLFN